MSRNRFTLPSVIRIQLSDDDWIEVKSELNTGDQRKQDNLALVATVVIGKDGKETVINRIDWSRYEILRAALWLTDWHIHDSNGKVPPLSLESISALNSEDFEEIDAAIFKHMVTTADEKKKVRALKASQNGVAFSAESISTS